jgi:hypothetical protein
MVTLKYGLIPARATYYTLLRRINSGFGFPLPPSTLTDRSPPSDAQVLVDGGLLEMFTKHNT